MDILPFYELEELLESLKSLNDKEEEQRKKDEKGQRSQMPNMNANSMQRQMSSSTPNFNMPSMPNFKL